MIRKLTKLVLLIAAMCLLGISSACAQGSYNLDEYEKATGKKIEAFHESPILRVKVAAGELPPVEERLPENPLVMEPWEEVGKYGGTLNYFDTGLDYDHYMQEINEVWLLELAPSSATTRWDYFGGTILPGILEFWEQSDDAKTFTLRIRKGLKWSDGVPVTTEDVRYTIEDVIMNKEITPRLPGWANWGGEPVELEVVDKYTFRLKFVKTYGLFIPQLSGPQWTAFTLIKPKHYLKEFHTKYTPLEKLEPVMKEKGYSKDEWGIFYGFMQGQGKESAASFIPAGMPNVMNYPTLHPWINISEPRSGDFVMERNPYFYKVDPEGNQLPYIDKIHKRLIADTEMDIIKILAGETDLSCQFLQLKDYPLLMKNREKGGYEVMLLKIPAQQLPFFVSLSPDDLVLRNIFQDARFRQAISLALNREEIKESIFLGMGRVAQFAASPGSVGYKEEFERAYVEYDVERANKLLDEMGLQWDENHEYRLRVDGKKLTIPFIYYGAFPLVPSASELASEYWKDIGIDVPIKEVDGNYYWEIKSSVAHLNAWGTVGGDCMTYGYGPGFFPVTAKQWCIWDETNGEKGAEPTAPAKRMFELYKAIHTTPSYEVMITAAEEMWRLQAENLWLIGTVIDIPKPYVYSKKLGNISVGEEKGYITYVMEDNAEQFFFKE